MTPRNSLKAVLEKTMKQKRKIKPARQRTNGQRDKAKIPESPENPTIIRNPMKIASIPKASIVFKNFRFVVFLSIRNFPKKNLNHNQFNRILHKRLSCQSVIIMVNSNTMHKTKFFSLVFVAVIPFFLTDCKTSSKKDSKQILIEDQEKLANLLQNETLDQTQRYSIVNKIALNYMLLEKNQDLILFLTSWVEDHPDDIYNAYWLGLTAEAYRKTGAEPIAEYYYDRILRNYPDLSVKGKSIHFECLQQLIRISKNSKVRIKYFTDLLNRFPANVSITELYLRLALEYEKENEWDEALKAYTMFLAQPDSSTIQISGEPNAFKKARQIVGFSKSDKDWTFESLSALENAIKKAIRNYDWRALDRYKAKVNFFSISWKQDEIDSDQAEEFSLKSYMRGNKVSYNAELDELSNANEAYLRTWGWSQYVSTWYLYFRKVNYPRDPEINGNWEWAGIYLGEKL